MNPFPQRCQLCTLPFLGDFSVNQQNWLLTYLCLGLGCNGSILQAIATHNVKKPIAQLRDVIKAWKETHNPHYVANNCALFYNASVRPLLFDSRPITKDEFFVHLGHHELSQEQQTRLQRQHLQDLQLHMYAFEGNTLHIRRDVQAEYLRLKYQQLLLQENRPASWGNKNPFVGRFIKFD